MQIGLGVGTLNSTLRFDDDREVDVEMTTVSLSGAWLMNDRWTIRAAVGALLDGSLQTNAHTTHDFETGGLAAIGLEYRARTGDGYAPFVDLSLFVSGLWTQTVAPDSDTKTDYFASDARLGARAGWNVKGRTFPYVAARVFGGPVTWEMDSEDVDGTDIHHYQLALGTAAQVGPVGVYVEWAPVGEQAVSAGLSTSW